MKKTLITILSAFAIWVLLPITSSAADQTVEGTLIKEVKTNGEKEIVSYSIQKEDDKVVKLPKTPKGPIAEKLSSLVDQHVVVVIHTETKTDDEGKEKKIKKIISIEKAGEGHSDHSHEESEE